MIKELTAQGEAELTIQFATFKLLLVRLPDIDSFPLSAVSGVGLGPQAELAGPAAVFALQELAPNLLSHLLLHLSQVLFFLFL